MSYVYDQRKRPQGSNMSEPRQTAAPGPGMESLMAGTARPTAAQKGQPFDLDAAMKAKMENAFGDLSAVKLYRSQAVADAGAEAIAQGNEIAFAPGMTDFSTRAGQERLGHELSHVMSQRSGQVRGSGFLNNASLEARADREGALAAAGQQVCAGPVTHTLSGAAPSPFMAGAMQAKKYKEKKSVDRDYYADEIVNAGDAGYESLDPEKWMTVTRTPTGLARLFKSTKQFKARIARKAYEMSPEELRNNKYNPDNSEGLGSFLNVLDQKSAALKGETPEQTNGRNNREVWSAFQRHFGNPYTEAKTEDGKAWNMNELDHDILTAKLKNMSRMVMDYPELKGNIRQLSRLPRQNKPSFTGTYMSTAPNALYRDELTGGKDAAFLLFMNSQIDAAGEDAKREREQLDKKHMRKNAQSAEMEYAGNHEMGHMLNYLLVKEKFRKNGFSKRLKLIDDDVTHGTTAGDLVDRALKASMPEEEYNRLVRYEDDQDVDTKDSTAHKKRQIDLKASGLAGGKNSRGYTSKYGATDATEFFAEAFADVYRNGKEARPVSIKLVKLYEEEMAKAKKANA